MAKLFTQKSKREVTYPQQGERTVTGEKLPRADRHKNLKPMYVMVQGDKPWKSKRVRAF